MPRMTPEEREAHVKHYKELAAKVRESGERFRAELAEKENLLRQVKEDFRLNIAEVYPEWVVTELVQGLIDDYDVEIWR